MAKRTAKRNEALAQRTDDGPSDAGWALFNAETNYAESIMRNALGDLEGCIARLEDALECVPGFAPAKLTLGSICHQQRREDEGRRLFREILDAPADTPDLLALIDETGDFLIGRGLYQDAYTIYLEAAARYPDHAVFHQGISCCAGHLGRHEEALAASRRAIALEPANQKFMNDLGWTLYESGDLPAARETLERAVAMDPADDLARENLRIVVEAVEGKRWETGADHRADRAVPPDAGSPGDPGTPAPPDQGTLFDA